MKKVCKLLGLSRSPLGSAVVEKKHEICYYNSELRRSWSSGSWLEFLAESWFALPDRCKPKRKEPFLKGMCSWFLSQGHFLVVMNLLLEKYNDYMRLEGCHVEYKLDGGTKIEFSFKEENFLHLIGLHKLTDIQLIQFWLDRNNKTIKLHDVIRKIKNETFTDSMVKGSVFFHKIQQRYESFSYANLTTLNYTDAIIDFNASLVNSKLKSDYILFEEKPTGEYNHMGVAYNSLSGSRYVETFIHEPSGKYLNGQTIVKVKECRMIDKKGNIIIEDSY